MFIGRLAISSTPRRFEPCSLWNLFDETPSFKALKDTLHGVLGTNAAKLSREAVRNFRIVPKVFHDKIFRRRKALVGNNDSD